jgi:hypothetical protein
MTDLSQAQWRKSSRSGQSNGACVEVAALPALVAVRDSLLPEAGAHVVSRSAFVAFLDDVKAGRYDR